MKLRRIHLITIMSVLILTALATATLEAATWKLDFNESAPYGRVMTEAQHDQLVKRGLASPRPGNVRMNATSVNPPTISQMPVATYVASVCASTSTNKSLLYPQAMAFLSGQLPQYMDRTVSPAAYYLIPHDGLQLHDWATTAFKFWNGTTNVGGTAFADENGCRMIFSVIGTNDVTRYAYRITSSSTNVPNTTFGIDTNSAGQIIGLNSQYVGISFGANNILESWFDKSIGAWVQGGDDHIYVSGEDPTSVSLSMFIRFGATAVIQINNIGEFNPLKAEFASSPQWIKGELLYDGAVVSTYAVTSSIPRLTLALDGDNVTGAVISGQKMLTHHILWASDVRNPVWQLLLPDAFSLGTPWHDTHTDPKRYYRAVALPTQF